MKRSLNDILVSPTSDMKHFTGDIPYYAVYGVPPARSTPLSLADTRAALGIHDCGPTVVQVPAKDAARAEEVRAFSGHRDQLLATTLRTLLQWSQ